MTALRASYVVAVVASTCLSVVAAAPDQGAARSPAALLDAVRQAIGIRPDQPSPRSLRLVGTDVSTQAVITDVRAGVTRVSNMEDAIEFRIAFPDRFAQIATNDISERRHGFNGRNGFQGSRAVAPNVTTNPGGVPPPQDVTDFWRQELARLMLGMLARTDTLRRVTVTSAGPHALRLRGSMDPEVTIELDPDTHLPARLIWRQRMIVLEPGRILRTGGGTVSPGRLPSNTPEETVTMSLTDHRDVDGLKLPFQVSWMAKGVTLREMRFEQIELNPVLTDDDFQ